MNQGSKLDRNPIPNVEDLSVSLAGSLTFTKLDLISECHYIHREEHSCQYLAINAHKMTDDYVLFVHGLF